MPKIVFKSKNVIKTPHATVKEAVQKRITPADHSSIIPGIDVNELKHSLDILKYALDYSEAIVDTVRMPLVVLNKELRVLTANRSFYDTFKLEAPNTENQLIYQLNENAWNIKKLRTLLEKILPKNSHFDNYEVELNHPHLGRRTMLLSARKTYRQVNNTEAILLAFEDITERKQLDMQKDDFIGIVSHELKNPITGIQAYSQLLERHLAQSQDIKGSQYLSKMTAQMDRLTQLMASFINVYKIQNNKLELNKTTFKLNELIIDVVSNFTLTSKSHRLIYKNHGNLKLHGDQDRMRQVLVNLFSNAIKYSPKADKVIIGAHEKDNEVIVSVKDFGIGIPKEDQKRIFDRFFRVKSKSHNNITGLGLGLYISSQIIKLHKGKVWIESEPGEGSTIYFSIPTT